MKYTYNFGELDNSNVSTVGGKNASLGEMFRQLSSKGINIPDGFASSADAYREYIQQNEIEEKISNTLSEMDVEDSKSLEKTGKKCRDLIMKGDIPKEIREALEAAWDELKDREDSLSSVAVRSSATAEDLPDASFAG
ncbi:MAG: PEP/pyruvate-binding domain-containing protein, partial [Bacteroidota bacterium]